MAKPYKVKFYKYGTNVHGDYVQTDVIDKEEEMTKEQLFKIVDLRHPTYTEREFFEVLLENRYRDGTPVKEWRMSTRGEHYLIVTK